VLVPDFRGRLERALEVLDQALRTWMKPQPRDRPAPLPQGAPRRPTTALAQAAQGLQGAASARSDQVGPDGGPGRNGRRDTPGDARPARARRGHAHDAASTLQPSPHHLPVERYVHPDTFAMFEREAQALGFTHAAVGAMVRSSYQRRPAGARCGCELGEALASHSCIPCRVSSFRPPCGPRASPTLSSRDAVTG